MGYINSPGDNWNGNEWEPIAAVGYVCGGMHANNGVFIPNGSEAVAVLDLEGSYRRGEPYYRVFAYDGYGIPTTVGRGNSSDLNLVFFNIEWEWWPHPLIDDRWYAGEFNQYI